MEALKKKRIAGDVFVLTLVSPFVSGGQKERVAPDGVNVVLAREKRKGMQKRRRRTKGWFYGASKPSIRRAFLVFFFPPSSYLFNPLPGLIAKHSG